MTVVAVLTSKVADGGGFDRAEQGRLDFEESFVQARMGGVSEASNLHGTQLPVTKIDTKICEDGVGIHKVVDATTYKSLPYRGLKEVDILPQLIDHNPLAIKTAKQEVLPVRIVLPGRREPHETRKT